jgi:hypothetical protein
MSRTTGAVKVLAVLVATLAMTVACFGPPRAEAADPALVPKALGAMPPLDTLAEEEAPLSRGGAWAQLGWVSGPGSVVGGWSSTIAFPSSNGAYWTGSAFTDDGPGEAAVARLLSRPGTAGRAFALWLNMPTPQSIATGYELRFQEQPFPGGYFMVTLKRIDEGSPAYLGGVREIQLASGDQFAIVDQGGTLSAWVDDAGWNGKADFTRILTAKDAHYESGYAGMEATGTPTRLRRFKAGSLAFSSF